MSAEHIEAGVWCEGCCHPSACSRRNKGAKGRTMSKQSSEIGAYTGGNWFVWRSYSAKRDATQAPSERRSSIQRPKRPLRPTIAHSADGVVHGMLSRASSVERGVRTLDAASRTHITASRSVDFCRIPVARSQINGIICIRANYVLVPSILGKGIGVYMRDGTESPEDLV
jgi:hypothetical protein